MLRITISLFIVFILIACSHEPKTQKVTIAINPWPGYELLYLAKNKGFFEDVGLNLALAQTASLSDGQRAYISGRVDGFASTIVEAVQAQEFGGDPLNVVLLADYSNGGDVILSQAPYQSLSDLKGKKIGCEVSSLGIYILARALTVYGMTLDDVEIINVEQGNALHSLNAGQIDAMVTYPPYSFEILNDSHQVNHRIFTTAEIPNEILDTISISKKVVSENPDLVPKLHQAWQMAYEYLKQHPVEAVKLMAEREKISEIEFNQSLTDIYLLNNVEQKNLLKNQEDLISLAQSVCDTLNKAAAFNSSCDHIKTLFYSGI
ncbi:hypothetical protein GCM10007978_27220 [Shewanella hanedai]|uniref:Nitrate ABC transporter n=1 Tax=Shewanella hanedai TaxID=25 RepID=A0A553JLU0_SHEHA|nr:ABC transporter substrate-binding protein [Shewanella hanedai]TRY13401.1 nitrate ABC transporter [Shewanella hanedai]GGI88042.1 hypothetical protein GCM10007978_27220 [Shewanella hanedai]